MMIIFVFITSHVVKILLSWGLIVLILGCEFGLLLVQTRSACHDGIRVGANAVGHLLIQLFQVRVYGHEIHQSEPAQ